MAGVSYQHELASRSKSLINLLLNDFTRKFNIGLLIVARTHLIFVDSPKNLSGGLDKLCYNSLVEIVFDLGKAKSVLLRVSMVV